MVRKLTRASFGNIILKPQFGFGFTTFTLIRIFPCIRSFAHFTRSFFLVVSLLLLSYFMIRNLGKLLRLFVLGGFLSLKLSFIIAVINPITINTSICCSPLFYFSWLHLRSNQYSAIIPCQIINLQMLLCQRVELIHKFQHLQAYFN